MLMSSCSRVGEGVWSLVSVLMDNYMDLGRECHQTKASHNFETLLKLVYVGLVRGGILLLDHHLVEVTCCAEIPGHLRNSYSLALLMDLELLYA